MGKVKGKHRLDKYYQLAKEHGYRSRASWKLIQLDSKFSFLKSAHAVLDLCAAPGGWMQVAVQRAPVGSLVLGLDLVPIAPIRGAVALQQDITKSECKSMVKRVMEERGVMAFDVILHDGSPNVGGAWAQEAMSQNALVIDSVKLATQFLAPKGTFVTKVFRSQDYSSVLYCLKQLFEKVEVDKPAASRSASAEIYVLGLRYKAPAKIDPRLLDFKHLFQGSIEPQKKVIDVLRVTKQKRHRDGYEDGETISKKMSTAADFISSDSPLEILGSVTTITFEDPASLPIKDHSYTSEEVKALCDDLRVLGKQDFKYLLKWRMQLRKALSPSEKATPPTPTTATDVDKGDEENEDDKLLNEMEELTYAMERKKKREKKLLAKRQAKDKSRKATGMQIDALEDGYVDHELFSLSSIKGKKDLAAVDSTEDDDGNVDSRDSEDEQNREGSTEDESSSDVDSEEERRRYDEKIEEILDHAYEEYAAKKDGSTKQRKRAKQAYEQLEDGDGDDDILSDHDSDKGEADPEANPLMVPLDDGEGPTQEEITNRWFGQDIFAEAVEQGDLGKYDSDDEMEVDNREENPVIPKKSKVKQKQDAKTSIPDEAKETEVNNAAGPKGSKLQASKVDDEFEIVPAPATDSSDDSSSDDTGDDDVETKAEILACAKKMLRKKQRNQILDDAYNKYMFDDDGLPTWFIDEEKRHRRPIKPVTKEEIVAMRAQFKEINARPAKKVAEAKARKKRIAMKKLDKVRQKANSISDQADISERSKRKQIEQLYKKATPKKPQKEYVVAKKGVQVRAGKGKVLVDRRMKKDARARGTGKPGKGGSRNGKNGKAKKGKGSGKASGMKGNKNKGGRMHD
ncbi:isoflavone reductase-like protein [Hibiscus syriacus]|uniref:Putative rRNA methyltransferase n=1 Tax=Hibiscus syriacus TaxID=106335 RepID=A0A6A2X0J5_HIBSY|nr:adoMet-dependent rRNA methyltransferase spb1-like [Hibiscus syriacus]KAE8668143.1 isoflavone reductase-like protein [Hibiscus syriacus]